MQWLEGRKEVLKDVQTSKNCIRPKHNTILSNIPLQEHYSLQIATDLCRLEETLRGEIDKINKNLEYDLDEVISKQLASFQRQKHANQHILTEMSDPKSLTAFNDINVIIEYKYSLSALSTKTENGCILKFFLKLRTLLKKYLQLMNRRS